MNSLNRLSARLATFLALIVMPTAAFAQQATNQGGDPITSALLWMQAILLGPIATALAVMAVAGVGFMMLTGRMNWRYGATVIIGVFIIFGAPRLVATIAGGAGV
ncbi:MAG: TrbC/VirB2 family protein [Pseudomonadota bacterium]